MRLGLAVKLPWEAVSVPLVRRLLRACMQVLGVTDDCARDVELALAEACTNVLDHGDGHEQYDVLLTVDEDFVMIDVVNAGAGYGGEAAAEPAGGEAERGRGITLMRALVERVSFEPAPECGTVVHFEKQLSWVDGAPGDPHQAGPPAR